MQEAHESGAVPRNELLERLRNLEPLQSQGTLAELAYRRAREALEKALEDASRIRLEALEDARNTREHELSLLMESLKALRQSAETQVQAIIAAAEIEAEQTRERARAEARATAEAADRELQLATAEARALREAAEARSREVADLESRFNDLIAKLSERIGVTEQPSQGWFGKLFK